MATAAKAKRLHTRLSWYVVFAGDWWIPAVSLAGVVPGYLAFCLASLADEGKAVCLHIRRNHRANWYVGWSIGFSDRVRKCTPSEPEIVLTG